MRVSKNQAAKNREALVAAAGKLFRARGMDGVGVAEVAKEAGLTHGALYAHFSSKEMLAAEALSAGLERSHQAMIRSRGEAAPDFTSHLDYLLSPRMRDTVEMGCPMTASASEIGRQSVEVSTRFAAGLERMIATIQATLGGGHAHAEARRIAIAVVAAEIGAISIARAVAKSDLTLSNDILSAVRVELGRLESHGVDRGD
ncbi:TetR/AcrR family transcriptional regulator [Bradyrhizobium erythrophlei]|uniref:Transcriptional regulator, TetR family n=1 Tax=Bradyrhizobium erythrophlei TaxID=1437360 RepID=A0A1H4WS75_9BRAD|nr:TetR/AcrR family transcriptional regulator [Bradyrhizobium erythrophlei]SEC96222.1 transcriptional regulator, TetR family [Bradyrhizobium erythrophlei]